MRFNFLLVCSFCFFAFSVGKIQGMKKATEEINFDRELANNKLNQCLRIIRNEL